MFNILNQVSFVFKKLAGRYFHFFLLGNLLLAGELPGEIQKVQQVVGNRFGPGTLHSEARDCQREGSLGGWSSGCGGSDFLGAP